MSTKITITDKDFIAEPHIYCDMARRGIYVSFGNGRGALVPSEPLPCEDCENKSDHGQCRVVRGLIVEADRLTEEVARERARLRRWRARLRWRLKHRYDPRNDRLYERLHERWMDHPATDFNDWVQRTDESEWRRWNRLDPMGPEAQRWRARVAAMPLAGPKGMLP